MAAIVTLGSGNWSSTTASAPWPSGTLPTATDDVTIATGHVVTLDTLLAVCNTLTASGTAQLVASKTVSSKLAVTLGSVFNNTSALDLDVSTNSAITCTVVHSANGSTANNGCNITVSANIRIRGAYRKRVTRLTGAVVAGSTGTASTVVDDATGWLAGDDLVLATTQAYNNTARVDCVTITSIVAGTGTKATIYWDQGVTPMLYTHADRCYVGNMSSNLAWKPSISNGIAYLYINQGAAATMLYPRKVQDVQFFQQGGTYPYYSLYIDNQYDVATPWAGGGVFNNTWHKTTSSIAFIVSTMYTPIPRSDNTVYASLLGGHWCTDGNSTKYGPLTINVGDETNLTVFRGGLVFPPPGGNLINPILSSCSGVASDTSFVIGGEIWSCSTCTYPTSAATLQITGAKIDGSYSSASSNGLVGSPRNSAQILTDCTFSNFIIGTTIVGGSSASYIPQAFTFLNNINADPTLQALYSGHSGTVPIQYRDNANGYRSNAALRLMTNKLTNATQNWTVTHSVLLLSQSGAAIRVIGYVKYDNAAADGSPPTITISGKGITPVVFTCPVGANIWNKYDFTVTQTSGTSGNLTMVYSHQITTNTQTNAWFSGVPDAPWIDTCRHYGFVEDPTNKLRVVDSVIVLSETAANAITGLSANWTTSTLTVSGTRSLSEIYDWVHAQLVLNLGFAQFFTSADGNNFNCSWNITVNGGAITGSGVISMPAKTLTLSTGGTVAANVSAFAGSNSHLTLTGLQPGSDVVILYPGTSGAANEIKSTTVTGSTFTLAYDYTTLPAVDINVYLSGYKPYTPIRNLSLTSSGVTIPVAQIQDRNYQ